MKILLQLCGVFLLLFCFSTVRCDGKSVFCFYNIETTEKSGAAGFTVHDIEGHLCTHAVVTSDPESKSHNLLLIHDGGSVAQKLIYLRKLQPQLKLLISINEEHLEPFNKDEPLPNILAKEVVAFLQKYKFDGVVLNFFPTEDEKINYTNLTNTLNQAFKPHKHILVVYGADENDRPEPEITDGYDIPVLSQNVDFLLLDVADYYNPWSKPDSVDYHAPLYRRPTDPKNNKSADYEINRWISKGFPADKIIMKIQTEGFSYRIKNKALTQPILVSEFKSKMSYNQVCLAVRKEGWQLLDNINPTVGPYTFSPEEFDGYRIYVIYNDPDMAVVKSKFILSKGLGGAAVDVTKDDFRDSCGKGPFPMLSAISKTLSISKSNDSSTTLSNPCLFLIALALLLSTTSRLAMHLGNY